MKKMKRNGFTLVELLAVIVILAIILVIAVPKVMSIIEDAKKGTLESTAKMIASQAEKQKVQNTVLGKDKKITCDSVAKINDGDYANCSIEFVDNTAKVTIEGSGKFAGLWVCDGTKTSAEATKEECVIATSETCFIGNNIHFFRLNDLNSCENFINSKNSEARCTNNIERLNKDINEDINEELYTVEEIIESGAVTYEGIGYSITGYDDSCGMELSIPNSISGVPVISIESFAFQSKKLTSLKLPNSLKWVGLYAFFDNEISDIVIPGNVEYTAPYSFAQSYEIQYNINIMSKDTEIDMCTFGYMNNVNSHNVSDSYVCEMG